MIVEKDLITNLKKKKKWVSHAHKDLQGGVELTLGKAKGQVDFFSGVEGALFYWICTFHTLIAHNEGVVGAFF